MSDPPDRRPPLSSRQNRALAALSGHLRFLVDHGGEFPMAELVAQVHEISTDPLVLGHALGDSLKTEDPPKGWPTILAILREAGADQQRALLVSAWHEERLRRRGRSEGHPIL